MRTNGGEGRQDPHARFNLRDIRKKGGGRQEHYYIYVLILLHMCPHAPTDVSSYSYGCVLILLYLRERQEHGQTDLGNAFSKK